MNPSRRLLFTDEVRRVVPDLDREPPSFGRTFGNRIANARAFPELKQAGAVPAVAGTDSCWAACACE